MIYKHYKSLISITGTTLPGSTTTTVAAFNTAIGGQAILHGYLTVTDTNGAATSDTDFFVNFAGQTFQITLDAALGASTKYFNIPIYFEYNNIPGSNYNLTINNSNGTTKNINTTYSRLNIRSVRI